MLKTPTTEKRTYNDEIQSAIDALEQHIGTTPPAAGHLLTLIDLCAANGSLTQCREYTTKLAGVIGPSQNVEFSQVCHHFLSTFANEIPGSLPEMQRLQSIADSHADLINRTSLHFEERKIYKYDLASEIVLAQRLNKARVLKGDDLATVFDDLCNYSSYMADSPSTVLHILNDRSLASYDKAIEHISEDSSLPMVALDCFELHKEAFSLLHMEFMKYRAALVFDVMEGEALVAILNPYNNRLQSDVAMLTNTRCHYYMVKSEDYDRAVDAVRRAYLKESGVF